MIDATEREDLKNKLEFLIGEIENKHSISSSPSSSQSSEQEKKRGKFEIDFAEWQDEGSPSAKSELDIYCGLKAPSNTKELNIWWKNHQLQLKNLSKLAKQILCIPASSASCERNFSAAGYLINERRTRLDPAIIDASLFLHNNLYNFTELYIIITF